VSDCFTYQLSVFHDISSKYARHVNIVKGVENIKSVKNYDPYTQALLDGKLPWLEEACQDSIAGPAFQHFVAVIKSGEPLADFKPHTVMDVDAPSTPVSHLNFFYYYYY